MTPHAKFQGATSTWVVRENTQFDARKFLFFSFLHHAKRSHLWTHPHAQYVKLEIYNYFPDTTPHAKFQGLCQLGWSGQIASLRMKKFVLFSLFFITPTGRTFGHIPTHNTSLYVVPAKEVPFGG